MISKIQPYKVYAKEFKLEAVRLMEQSNKTVSEIAVELGIRRNQLCR
jgi:transposase